LRRDGIEKKCRIIFERAPALPLRLFPPVFLFLGRLLETVFAGHFQLGPAVFAGDDFTYFGVVVQDDFGSTNGTFGHISPPKFFVDASIRCPKQTLSYLTPGYPFAGICPALIESGIIDQTGAFVKGSI
jgi:hypothetical protein